MGPIWVDSLNPKPQTLVDLWDLSGLTGGVRGSTFYESSLHSLITGPTIMENQMEKKMENEMDTGII